MCISKMKSGKNTSQNCKKRNAVYEIWCEPCRERDEKKSENEKDGEEDKKNNETRMYKYIGRGELNIFQI